jgi:hypothetical protein
MGYDGLQLGEVVEIEAQMFSFIYIVLTHKFYPFLKVLPKFAN